MIVSEMVAIEVSSMPSHDSSKFKEVWIKIKIKILALAST